MASICSRFGFFIQDVVDDGAVGLVYLALVELDVYVGDAVILGAVA